MLKTAFNVIIHPFDEFYKMKTKEKNYFPVSFIVLVLFFFTAVIEYQMTDFVFNFNRTEQLNIWLMLMKTVVIFILWVLSNWAFCTLSDGEGTLQQIFCLSAVALLPYILAVLLKTFLSTFLIADEGIFLNWLVLIGEVYSGVLFIIGLQTIHGYTFKKTIYSVVITIIGIAIMLFIAILLFSLLKQFSAFVMTIFTEICLMIGG